MTRSSVLQEERTVLSVFQNIERERNTHWAGWQQPDGAGWRAAGRAAVYSYFLSDGPGWSIRQPLTWHLKREGALARCACQPTAEARSVA